MSEPGTILAYIKRINGRGAEILSHIGKEKEQKSTRSINPGNFVAFLFAATGCISGYLGHVFPFTNLKFCIFSIAVFAFLLLRNDDK
jgi:hypothetical protein